ncbi:tautomerase family protein [Francisella frigiditurris]|uniref:5-carboxymethyl-2-hydroxymuconate isomerase family protein n=1 Tax=Francisella frigiditurris TaxID=1542390 RepID=A0A1J0KVS5_9GAMM|nr:hypothetical protein [Francisella frigiditurris]APC97807.1 hypothetical protein KX01_868 [Francisella frigiditurris]
MPHIILEIPSSFDTNIAKDILNRSQSILLEKLPTKIETFKNRYYKYDYCLVANSQEKELIGLTIKVLSGRTEDLLKEIALDIKEEVRKILISNKIKIEKYSYTVEILELSQAYVN